MITLSPLFATGPLTPSKNDGNQTHIHTHESLREEAIWQSEFIKQANTRQLKT